MINVWLQTYLRTISSYAMILPNRYACLFFNQNVYIAEGRLGTEKNFYGPCFGVLPYDRLLWIGRDAQYRTEV
jgi:hypothetical protein